jgi:hypothetical protein
MPNACPQLRCSCRHVVPTLGPILPTSSCKEGERKQKGYARLITPGCVVSGNQNDQPVRRYAIVESERAMACLSFQPIHVMTKEKGIYTASMWVCVL